ncbi:MAG TPA: signal peptide peptidase SppA [Pseudomonadales bacterium]|nr:signal peptide peptidase SppA [Pseudomonadales bacterium]
MAIDPNNPNPSSKEWKLIEKMLLSSLDEQKKARRWGIFFKLLTFLYVLGIFLVLRGGNGELGQQTGSLSDHTAVIELNGEIGADTEVNADHIMKALKNAFKAQHAKGIILRINSPGGSPVQSALIYKEIMRLKKLHPEKKVYAVISDIGASGAYYVASAADKIYADEGSLVGSIGVVSPGFGFVGLIDKLGIERRLITSGDHKGMLDPFSPRKPDDEAHFSTLLKDVHQQFIDAVKAGRGDRLKENSEIFSGMFWDGRQAKALGLIDDFGSAGSVARDEIHQENVVDYTPKPDPFEAFAKKVGMSMAASLKASMLGIGLQ